MSKLIDLIGKRYGNLVVIEREKNAKGGIAVWKCLCDCGNTTIVRGNNLKSGGVKSCGCKRVESHTTTHGMSNTKIYRIWASMKSRCYCKVSKSYKDYGERGITVCDEWKNSFESFFDWAMKNGYSENLSIERKDLNGNYSPSNCIWIPFNKQQNNRRTCRLFEYDGEVRNLTEWCDHFKLPFKVVHSRIYKLGWSFERAVSEPIHIEKRNKKNV